MTGPPPHAAAELPGATAAPGAAALFLDVDGTLLHIADTPDAVEIGHDTIDLVRRAHRAASGALALITGRRILDVDRLFAPLVLPVAGQHGFERRDAAGRMHRPAPPIRQLAAARAALAPFAERHPGVLIEDKEFALAVHYRLAPAAREAAHAVAERLAASSEGALAVQSGKMVFELKPTGKDKGTAVAEFMAEPPFRGLTPLFVGDDLTDEYGFSIVNRLGGVSVKVGEGPTVARRRLPGVAAVRAWLERWIASGTAQEG